MKVLDRKLFDACRRGQVQLAIDLLDRGADIEAKFTKTEGTPLMKAVVHDRMDVAMALIDRGANTEAQDRFGKSIHSRVCYFDNAVWEFLVTKNPFVVGCFDQSPLHQCAKGGYINVMKRVLDHPVDINAFAFGETPLHLAARYGHKDTCQLLLAHGADLNPKNKWMNTALEQVLENLMPRKAGYYSADLLSGLIEVKEYLSTYAACLESDVLLNAIGEHLGSEPLGCEQARRRM